MRLILGATVLMFAFAASAGETFQCEGKEVSKKDVILALVKNAGAKCKRIQDLELSDKATIKVKR